MDLNTLKTLVLVAKHGSFAATARVLDIDPSSVSRLVSNAEAELRLRLFQRSTRSLSITEEGAQYIAHIAPLLEELDKAHDVALNAGEKPHGFLKLTTSVAFAQTCLTPKLAEFMAQYPDISIELLPTDSNLDLAANNIDLAIRLTPSPTGDLIRTKLADTKYFVCASPKYLAEHAPIREPSDLIDHNCVLLALPDYRNRWRFRKGADEPFEVPVHGKLTIGNVMALRQAANDGLGPVLLADWLVASDIENGSLVNLLPDYQCAATDFDTAIWALYPTRSYLPQKVRVMIDFLRQNIFH